MPLDIAAVRAAYPGLAEGYAQFDGAGGTLVAEPVAAAVAAALRTSIGNRTDAFATGRRAEEIITKARAAVGDLLGADPTGVFFGSSATSITYLISRTLSAGWGPGDEVVVSRLDHDANVRPWVQAAERSGATLRWAEFDPATGELPPDQYHDLVNERTKLVAFTAGSNAIGTVPAVRTIADIAHAVGSLVYIDGVHATPHRPVDVSALGADFYMTSVYKWSGPHIATCAADPALLERLHPEKLAPSSNAVPDRFEFGTLSFELLAGVTAAVEHLASLAELGRAAGIDAATVASRDQTGGATGGRRARLLRSMSAVAEYEQALFADLIAGLSGIPEVKMCAAPADRCPTVAFRVGDQLPAQTSHALGEQGICVYDGDYYAYEYFTRMGLRDTGGAVRAGVYHYNSATDVARLLDAVAGLVK
jgi:cysteine desulfurase family protein (TIGR01976 family)